METWDTLDHLKRHSESCTNKIKYKTVLNQIFKKNDNLIYKLCTSLNSVKEIMGDSPLQLDLYKYDYIITYDFECRLIPFIRNTFESNGPKLKWLNTHVPLSVAIVSYYPVYDIKFIYNEDPNE